MSSWFPKRSTKTIFSLIFLIKVHVKRLKSIVINCGESCVTPEKWTCTARQVYTRIIGYCMHLSNTEIVNII